MESDDKKKVLYEWWYTKERILQFLKIEYGEEASLCVYFGKRIHWNELEIVEILDSSEIHPPIPEKHMIGCVSISEDEIRFLNDEEYDEYLQSQYPDSYGDFDINQFHYLLDEATYKRWASEDEAVERICISEPIEICDFDITEELLLQEGSNSVRKD